MNTTVEVAGVPGSPSSSLSVSTMLVVASLFQVRIVAGVYDGLGRALPEAWPFLSSVCVAMSIVAWFRHYSRSHHIAWVLDMEWFLLAGWVVIVPSYMLKCEGKRALSRIGLFCLTYFAAWATGVAVRVWIQVLMAA